MSRIPKSLRNVQHALNVASAYDDDDVVRTQAAVVGANIKHVVARMLFPLKQEPALKFL